PKTNRIYLSRLSEDDESIITYDHLKVEDSFKTPRMYLKERNYKAAVQGYLDLKAQDSTGAFLREGVLNELGYELLHDEDYENAVEIFKLNIVLYPKSSNVYDSLGEAYLVQGDSVQALLNYSKALELNPRSERAELIVKALSKNQD
ncbi:MAG: tetratricopeptide repeat protein, partial [Bacteroidota bacterium]